MITFNLSCLLSLSLSHTHTHTHAHTHTHTLSLTLSLSPVFSGMPKRGPSDAGLRRSSGMQKPAVETVTAVDNEDDDDEDDDNDDDDDDDNDDGDYNDDCQVRSQYYSVIFTRRSVNLFTTPTTTHLILILITMKRKIIMNKMKI